MTREPHNPAKVISALERERDSLAARVSSLEADRNRGAGSYVLPLTGDEQRGLLAKVLSLEAQVESEKRAFATMHGMWKGVREKAQEVRRAWDAMRDESVCDCYGSDYSGGIWDPHPKGDHARADLRAAIDALVPPVAPPEDTKEARS